MNPTITRLAVPLITLLLVAATSSVLTRWWIESGSADAVYVLGRVSVTDPERLPDYQAIAQPIAHSAGGYEPLGFGQANLLEGRAPMDGLYFVERFSSAEALASFQSAIEESGALGLRDEVAEVHFMLSIPAYQSRD
jgi:uncharacterized protein (DUF1330 family)